jgi:small ligand-binding sensory domain FIST
MQPAAVALSRDPGTPAAVRAVIAGASAQLGAPAGAVILFASHGHDPAALVDAAVESTAAPVLGCSASGLVAGNLEIEEGPAVAALVLGTDEPVAPFLAASPARVTAPAAPGLALLFTDGYGQHPDRLAAEAASAWPGWDLAGAVTTGPDGAFPAHRWLGDELSATGVAGLHVHAPALIGVTQACRPVGPVHTVTRASGRVVAELDGRPAFSVFAERARPLLDDLGRAAQTVLLAVPDDPDDTRVESGYVVRGVLHFDPERGLLALSSPLAEGARLRFAVRDAFAARADLQRMVGDVATRLGGRRPRYGFYFAGAGRGRDLFGVDDHDVAYLRSALGDFPLVGLFTGGELGPAGRSARLHLFAGVLAVVP